MWKALPFSFFNLHTEIVFINFPDGFVTCHDIVYLT